MLTGLSLDTFKGFGQPQHVRLAPITLIFGPNSSGKSSILQSLLLLRQSLAETENPNTLLQFRGSLTDLGSFRDMVYLRDTDRVCKIAPLFDWPSSSPEGATAPHAVAPYRLPECKEVGLGLSIGWDRSAGRLRLGDISAYWDETGYPAFVLAPVEPTQARPTGLQRRLSPVGMVPGERRFTKLAILDPSSVLCNDLYGQFKAGIQAKTLEGLHSMLAEFASKESMTSLLERAKRLLPDPEVNEAALGQSANDLREWIDYLIRRITELPADLETEDNPNPEPKMYTAEHFAQDTELGASLLVAALHHFLPAELLTTKKLDSHREALEIALGEQLRLSPTDGPRALSGNMPDLMSLALSLANRLRLELERMVYIGPSRYFPARHAVFTGSDTLSVGKSGSLLPEALIGHPEVQKKTNRVLKQFEVGHQISLDRIGEADENLYRLTVLDEDSNTPVSLLDVGFGVSQVLPIVVQSMLSQGSLILIEQPELHLHPRLQAKMGQLFADSFHLNGNQFIVETHSEHIIYRIQRLIRVGRLEPEDVSVVYVMKDGDTGESACLPLRLQPDGEFEDLWPGGFFEEAHEEIFGGPEGLPEPYSSEETPTS